MNERQAHALAHPLDSARAPVDGLRSMKMIGGDLLVVILAVDR